jgi:hypothetical protein
VSTRNPSRALGNQRQGRGRRAAARPKKALAKVVQKRLELARDHVYCASGIVACCAYAAAGGLYPEPDRQDFGHALEGAHALIERAGGALIDVLDDELDEGGES